MYVCVCACVSLQCIYFDLGVTSRDLSMTLTVFLKNWRKWRLAPSRGWNDVIWGNRN